MIRAGIIGGAGYTAGELIRILVNHPDAELVHIQSQSHAGCAVQEVHEGLIGDTDLHFCASFDLAEVDVLFLCSAHGKSREFWAEHPCPDTLKVIDLAQDFRDESEGYVYGLPEWQADRIRGAAKIANPGCFATAIQLALLPMAAAGKLSSEIHVHAVTGSTGAGVKPGATTHFSWREGNLSTYKVFTHQHLKEIGRTLSLLQPGFAGPVRFIPVRGDFTRGIFATLTLPCDMTQEEALALYRDYYRDAAFTFVTDRSLDLKQVVNTNKCIVCPEVREDRIVLTSVIDNLLKGAAGQAVQNMNLAFGLPETSGLKLKASAF